MVQKDLINEDIELNPYLEINISFETYFDQYVAIYETKKGKKIFLEEKYETTTGYELANYNLKEKVSDTEPTAAFKCGNNSNCSNFYYFIDSFANMSFGYFYYYNPGRINHEEDPIIIKTKDVSTYFFMICIFLIQSEKESGTSIWKLSNKKTKDLYLIP